MDWDPVNLKGESGAAGGGERDHLVELGVERMVDGTGLKLDTEAVRGFCRKHHIRRLAVFGSALTGSLRPDGDLDLLVEFEPGHVPGLIRLAGMQNELSSLAGRQVDLRTPEDLSRYFRGEVERTAEVVFGAR